CRGFRRRRRRTRRRRTRSCRSTCDRSSSSSSRRKGAAGWVAGSSTRTAQAGVRGDPGRRQRRCAVRGRWMLTVATTGALVLADVVYAQAPPAPAPAPAEAAPSEGAPEGEQPLGEEEAMVLNFERADIREVIHSLATALGISYSID